MKKSSPPNLNAKQTTSEVSSTRLDNVSSEVSSATIEQLYLTACQFLQENKYAESTTVFTLLTTLNPYAHRFWLGLGLAEQQNKQYESALVAYDMATWTNNDDPAPYIYAADCYLSIKNGKPLGKKLAQEALEKAIKLASQRKEYASLKEEALKKQALLKSQK